MQRALNMLGLCRRAGCLKCGIPASEMALRAGEAKLVLLDAGASEASAKAVRDACAFRGVPLTVLPAGAIADAAGCPGRMAVAVTEKGFAKKIGSLLGEDG